MPEVDYITFHMWAQNWGWYSGGGTFNSWSSVDNYLAQNLVESKPTVLEEFGLSRD